MQDSDAMTMCCKYLIADRCDGMQVDWAPSTVHERAVTAPMQWAALSERMLRFQGQMPSQAALTHLEAVAAMMSTAFRVDTRRAVSQRLAQGPEVRRLTGNGVLVSSGVRETTWLLRHLRAFANAFPGEMLTAAHSSEQLPGVAAPKQLRSLWRVHTLCLNHGA